MIAGCYTTDFYCDSALHDHRGRMVPLQVTGETYKETVHKARAKGWLITRDRKAFCPEHKGKKAREAPSVP